MAYGDFASKGYAQCGGLFLFNNETKDLSSSFCRIADSTQVGRYSVFASFGHYKMKGLWQDRWALSFSSEQNVGTAGIRANFKNLVFSIAANSSPSLTSGITLHTGDSSLFATASLERGEPELATIRWRSENETDEISRIDAIWKTNYLRKSFSVGSKGKNYEIHTKLEQLTTTPYKQNREHFVKDSSHLWIWDSRYLYILGQNRFQLYYITLSADMDLYGNTYRDNSTKRFMYIPLDAKLHYGNIQWNNKSLGLQAHALKANFEMERNEKRFFETFAPNRILPSSLIQTLSFSFMQKNYLVDANLDIAAGTLGGQYHPEFNVTNNTKIIPLIGIQGYYTYDELSIEKTSETTKMIAYNSRDESWFWTLESWGTIAGLGLALEKKFQGALRVLSLEWNSSQLIPLKTRLIKHNDSDQKEKTSLPQKKKSTGLETSGLFNNGFASYLGISVKF